MAKINKLLVANRGEIACRVFQACRERGIGTIAIVAPGDEEARHVTFADQVMPISSYLAVDEIVGAGKTSGATLIHPGYGFLSERSPFALAVEKAGIAFLGPRAETMDLMGGKIAAKEFATSLGIPTLPWAKVKKGESLKEAAKKVGYPLLLKAAAGGGGKGMRIVRQDSELELSAEMAAAEALSAFGDGTLFLEKLVEKPRHVEVQAFGDGMGGGIHLYERDCSLQRRHQKIWEEAQAANLSEKTRNGLYEAAMKLIRATKYRSAGTLEFLVDASGDFYFLEMNTRLQVEHPVSELITGIDLVHAQIEQALNPSKAALTSVPSARGHAIEVRLYAEDPAQGFIPTPGKMLDIRFPMGPGIRVDSGIELGQSVNTQFDSMLAKIIVHAETRAQALARMQYALEETVVLGPGTNQSYLLALAKSQAVKDYTVYTQFLEKEFKFDSSVTVTEHAVISDALSGALPGSSRKGDIISPWSKFV